MGHTAISDRDIRLDISVVTNNMNHVLLFPPAKPWPYGMPETLALRRTSAFIEVRDDIGRYIGQIPNSAEWMLIKAARFIAGIQVLGMFTRLAKVAVIWEE